LETLLYTYIKESRVRATQIPPEGIGLIEKYVKTEDDAVVLAKRTIERYIDKRCSN